MKLMTKEQIEDAAHDITSWLQDAAGDSVYTEDLDEIESEFNHIKDIKKLVADAKSWPVQDVKGWFADVLYDDVDWLKDMTGDRIHDEGKGDYRNMIPIAQSIMDSQYSHAGLKEAMRIHIDDWIKRMEPRVWAVVIPAGGDIEEPIEITFEVPYGIVIKLNNEEENFLELKYGGPKIRACNVETVQDFTLELKG